MKYTSAALVAICFSVYGCNAVGAFSAPPSLQTTVPSRYGNLAKNILCATPARESEAVSSSLVSETAVVVSSPITQVFIEDTDAYGMVYNGNYLRAYERALYGFGKEAPSELLSRKNQDWSVVHVNKHRFKQSLLLGEHFVITGTRLRQSPTEETWDLIMTDASDTDRVYNTAIVTISSELPSFPPLTGDCKGADFSLQDDFVLHRDEFDITLPDRIPIRAALNPFERSRSNGLGGPDSLRRLKEDDGIITVVTSIDKASLIANEAARCLPGKTVTATSSIKVLRRGMVLKWMHTLWTNDEEGVPQRVAQAVVSLMMLDAVTRKPTSKIPEWVRKLISGEDS